MEIRMTDVMWRRINTVFGTSELETSGRSRYAVPIPNDGLREASSVADLGVWFSIGEAWSQVAMWFLPDFARDRPSVLDIGCGCGKMARFLVVHPNLDYLGLDAFRPAVDWCIEAFGIAYGDRFKFIHLDVYSKLYNQNGKPITDETRLPIEDGATHMVICGSLFTHLLEHEFHIYLREIARALAKGGRMLASTHNQPEQGRHFSGAVERIDMTDDFFIGSCERAGMRLVEKVGTLYGQEAFILERL
jgi:SAM-dependent methyltransferase